MKDKLRFYIHVDIQSSFSSVLLGQRSHTIRILFKSFISKVVVRIAPFM